MYLVVFKDMNWTPWKIFRKTSGNIMHSLISSHVHNFKLAMLLVMLPIILSYQSMLLVTLSIVCLYSLHMGVSKKNGNIVQGIQW